MTRQWKATPAGVSSIDGSIRIAAAFIKQNANEAARDYANDPAFLEALREFQNRFIRERRERAEQSRNTLWREMWQAGDPERASARGNVGGLVRRGAGRRDPKMGLVALRWRHRPPFCTPTQNRMPLSYWFR